MTFDLLQARVGYNVTVLDVNDNVPTFVGEVSRYEADVPQVSINQRF